MWRRYTLRHEEPLLLRAEQQLRCCDCVFTRRHPSETKSGPRIRFPHHTPVNLNPTSGTHRTHITGMLAERTAITLTPHREQAGVRQVKPVRTFVCEAFGPAAWTWEHNGLNQIQTSGGPRKKACRAPWVLLKEERTPASPLSGDVTLQLSDQLGVHRQEEKPPPAGPVCG